MRRFLALILSVFLCFSGVSHAEKITAAGDPSPPFLGPDLPEQGIAFELVSAAFKTQGYEIDMYYVPWERAIQGVKSASYDILIGTWWTEERTKFLNYSDVYLKNEIRFIKRIDDDFGYEGLKSLTGKTVGIVRGYGYDEASLKADNFERLIAHKLLLNLKRLDAKRLDLTLEDEIVAKFTMANDAPELLDKIAFTKNALSTNKLHVTSGLKNLKNDAIISAFNKGLAEIKQNVTYEAILKTRGLK